MTPLLTHTVSYTFTVIERQLQTDRNKQTQTTIETDRQTDKQTNLDTDNQ